MIIFFFVLVLLTILFLLFLYRFTRKVENNNDIDTELLYIIRNNHYVSYLDKYENDLQKINIK